MKYKRLLLKFSLLIIILSGLGACSPTQDDQSSLTLVDEGKLQENYRSEGLSNEESSEPDYAVVFPDDKVNEIIITISTETYETMFADMLDLYGEFGSGQSRTMGMDNHTSADGKIQPSRNRSDNPSDEQALEIQEGEVLESVLEENDNQQVPENVPQDNAAQARMNNRGGGGGMMDLDNKENPTWVEATIEFNGEIWEHVGIRYKGNSSLKSLWSSGSYKLPFKLDFDEFEETYPEIENQRFYGFKQLSFSANFQDSSYLREYIAADIFREAGVPAAQTAFYAVYIDTGDGPVYYGLYTAVEVVDDTVIETQFEDDSGNVYKPSGSAATFAEGTFNTNSFDKETNIEEADYSDIEALYAALHADTRTTDPEQWRSDLENVFDVDIFLRWLATNTLIQNWDTYGNMSHNYYLYHDPTTDKLVWIPWDNNESLSSTRGRSNSLSLDLSTVSDDWPLISYLIDDDVYRAQYNQYFEEIATTIFNPQRMESIYTDLHNLITDYVEMEQPGYTTTADKTTFENSVEDLIAYTLERYNLAMTFIQTLE